MNTKLYVSTEESEAFADGGSVRRYYRLLRIQLARLIRKSARLSKWCKICRGRKSLGADETRVTKDLKDIGLQHEGRRVYALSANPDRQLEGHTFFSQILHDCRLVGVGLEPCIDGYLVAQAVEVGNNNNTELVTAESRPLNNRKATVLKGRYASLCSHWCHWKGYYHWLLDILPRLELIDGDRKILVNSPLSVYERETLELFGVLEKCVEVKGDHIIVEDFQLVTQPSSSGVFNPFSVKFVSEAILSGVEKKLGGLEITNEKIYLSRVGERRSARNEEEVIDYLSSQGWRVVEAHLLSFTEQVALVRSAGVIMGVHGANLTNIMWGRPNKLKVIEMIPANRPVPSNENIALSLEMDYRAIICQSFADGAIQVDLEILKEVIADIDEK